jgi:hypothetical protein
MGEGTQKRFHGKFFEVNELEEEEEKKNSTNTRGNPAQSGECSCTGEKDQDSGENWRGDER